MKRNNTLPFLTKWTKVLSLGFTLFFATFALQSCNKDTIITGNSEKYEDFHKEMQRLWADHMTFTYTTVDAFFNNPDALSGNLNRLLENQKHIGAAIVPYYGQDAGDQLTALLTDHINLAVPVLTAAKSGDNPGLETALNNWYANAQDIADFLSGANPNWGQAEMREMMKMHIDQTTAYAVELLEKDYDNAIRIFDEASHHMKHMADDLSEGIKKQFPEKF